MGITAWYDGSIRTIGDKTIYPNDYKYSNIRAYLNGTKNQYEIDGGDLNVQPFTVTYEKEQKFSYDWSSKGFLQTAFTQAAQELIVTTNVDNSDGNVYYLDYLNPNNWANKNYHEIEDKTFVYEDTTDKIFLLSQKELEITSYGLSDSSVRTGIEFVTGDLWGYGLRSYNTYKSEDFNKYEFISRSISSPYSIYSENLTNELGVESTEVGVCPALCIE